jgi:hypothetical protein
MVLLTSLTFISFTRQGANAILVGNIDYSLSISVDKGLPFQITVTSEHTYKCIDIIQDTTIDTSTTSASIKEIDNVLQLIFTLDNVAHCINCAEIIPVSTKEFCIDEFGNQQTVGDAIKWNKKNNIKKHSTSQHD